MLKYTIELEHKDTGETEKFDITGQNASAALGKVANGKARFKQPRDGDPNTLTLQPFITDLNYIITRVSTLGREYPEMNGKII